MIDYKELDAHNPTIEQWRTKLHEQCPHLCIPTLEPGMWMGIVDEGELLSTVGMSIFEDGSVFIQYVMCEPSKRGLSAMLVMLPIVKASAKRFIFATELSNKRMLRIVKSLGAQPTAVILEVNNG